MEERRFGIGGVMRVWEQTYLKVVPSVVDFSGEFSCTPDGKIQGVLLDQYGPSSIEGTMMENQVTFEKTYTDSSGRGSSEKILYDLTHDEDGLWTGTYKGTDVRQLSSGISVECAILEGATPQREFSLQSGEILYFEEGEGLK